MPIGNAAGAASYLVNFEASATGDTFFLPFNSNEIHSVRLPAHPGAGDVKHVFTVELSGCAVFVDADPTGQWIYVHHANCVGGAYDVLNPAGQPPSMQTPAALTRLNELHDGALSSLGWTGAVQTGLFKADYYANLDAETARKRGQGRTNVQAWAGTTVWGFYDGTVWQFWYQTYGSMTYQRPWVSPKRYKVGKQVNVGNMAPNSLWEVAQFF